MFCLYCGETDEAPSREHVLQSGLGGTLTLPGQVCHDCNTNVFSSIDDYFVPFVRKTCDPAARRRPWVLQDGVTLHYEQASGAWINLRFTKEGRPLLPPQLVLSRELDRALYCGADERFQDAVPQFLEELTGPEHLRVTKMVVDDTGMDPPLTPALIRSAPGRIAVRATDEEQSEEVATRLRAGRYRLVDVSVGPTRSIEQPEVTGRLSFKLDLIARALAKNSLNLLCAARGKEVALQRCYDSLRVFARNDEGDPDDFLIVPWSAEKGIQPKPELPLLSRPEHHTGVLFATHGAVWAAWSFFGLGFALVRMGPDEEPWPPFPLVVDFDYRGKTHRSWSRRSPSELLGRCLGEFQTPGS